MLERRSLTQEDRDRIRAQVPQLAADKEMLLTDAWVVDPSLGTYFVGGRKWVYREPYDWWVFSHESRQIWPKVEANPRHPYAYLTWVLEEGLSDESVTRINAAMRDAYALYSGKHPRDVVVRARPPEPPMTAEDIRRSDALMKESHGLLMSAFRSAGEAARSREALARDVKRILIAVAVIIVLTIVIATSGVLRLGL